MHKNDKIFRFPHETVLSLHSPDGKLMSPFEKSSGGAMISISSSFPAEMVLEEVTMGLLLASEGVPRELRLTSTRLPPKLTRPSDPITCCKGKNVQATGLNHQRRNVFSFSAPLTCAYLWSVKIIRINLWISWHWRSRGGMWTLQSLMYMLTIISGRD